MVTTYDRSRDPRLRSNAPNTLATPSHTGEAGQETQRGQRAPKSPHNGEAEQQTQRGQRAQPLKRRREASDSQSGIVKRLKLQDIEHDVATEAPQATVLSASKTDAEPANSIDPLAQGVSTFQLSKQPPWKASQKRKADGISSADDDENVIESKDRRKKRSKATQEPYTSVIAAADKARAKPRACKGCGKAHRGKCRACKDCTRYPCRCSEPSTGIFSQVVSRLPDQGTTLTMDEKLNRLYQNVHTAEARAMVAAMMAKHARQTASEMPDQDNTLTIAEKYGIAVNSAQTDAGLDLIAGAIEVSGREVRPPQRMASGLPEQGRHLMPREEVMHHLSQNLYTPEGRAMYATLTTTNAGRAYPGPSYTREEGMDHLSQNVSTQTGLDTFTSLANMGSPGPEIHPRRGRGR